MDDYHSSFDQDASHAVPLIKVISDMCFVLGCTRNTHGVSHSVSHWFHRNCDWHMCCITQREEL